MVDLKSHTNNTLEKEEKKTPKQRNAKRSKFEHH